MSVGRMRSVRFCRFEYGCRSAIDGKPRSGNENPAGKRHNGKCEEMGNRQDKAGDRALPDGVRGRGSTPAEAAETTDGLQESRNRYRAVVEDIPAMICRFKPNGTLSFVNSFFCSFFAKYKDELIGCDFFELFPAAAAKKMRRRLATLTRQTPMTVYEHSIVDPGGRVPGQ